MKIHELATHVVPMGHPEYLWGIKEAEIHENLFERYELNTPLRICHFLAQAAHETGGFQLLRENMNYSARRIVQVFGEGKHSAKVTKEEAKLLAGDEQALAERVYGLGNPTKAAQLGNTEKGDGYRYRGGGLFQHTGRGIYQELAHDLHVDYVNKPNLIAQASYSVWPALEYWKNHNLNSLADANDIRAITKAINGGYNGYDDRVKWFNLFWKALEGDSKPWKRGNSDTDTIWLQQALNDLGATPPLRVDGRFGPATELAVKAFQHKNGLEVDGIPGPVTKATIKLRLSQPTQPEPTKKTDEGLIATGFSGTVLMDYAKELMPFKDISEYIMYAFVALLLVGLGMKIWEVYKSRRNLKKASVL